jgi:formylglycine-generating enzyme required for sulfatase activity
MRKVLLCLLFMLSFAPYLAQQPNIAMEFVKIPAGEFMMGCAPSDSDCDSNEKPLHKITITKAFEIGKYEVTQGQWQAVMGSNPSKFKGPNLPVENISWRLTQDFMQKMNDRKDGHKYRLPTEAEWEYASRAGHTGTPTAALDEHVWYEHNSGGMTHPVGMKQPNAWGLFDMQGNVWEWVQDWFGKTYYATSPAADPTGPPSGVFRVARGGSWSDVAEFTRLSMRSIAEPGYALGTSDVEIGFRCVREVE